MVGNYGERPSVDNKTMVIAALNPARENPNNIDLFRSVMNSTTATRPPLLRGRNWRRWDPRTAPKPNPAHGRTDPPLRGAGGIHPRPQWQPDHGFVPVPKGCRRKLVPRGEAAITAEF